jgi:hypothetical protein
VEKYHQVARVYRQVCFSVVTDTFYLSCRVLLGVDFDRRYAGTQRRQWTSSSCSCRISTGSGAIAVGSYVGGGASGQEHKTHLAM